MRLEQLPLAGAFIVSPERHCDARGWFARTFCRDEFAAHGLTGAPSRYALIDNARRVRRGLSRQEYAAAMGALFAPFTRVAAASPHAPAPTTSTSTSASIWPLTA